MKAAAFDYQRAETAEHALELLAQHGLEAKLIAGGQSLVPMMAMRLARPSMLIDINRLTELKTIQQRADAVVIGACVRQRDIEDAKQLHLVLPLVHRALQWVGHIQTRNRGTVGGSLVHADPSAELPLAALVLGAKMQLMSKAEGGRTVNAHDFFLGPMFTDIREGECLVAMEWPIWGVTGVGAAFEETSIRHGDFAMASAACQLQVDAAGVCQRASFGVGGVAGTPLAFPDLSRQLIGERLNKGLIASLAQSAARQCDPGSDMHATAAYRRHLTGVLAERVLLQAYEKALESK